jgi:cell division protein FtsB
VKKGLHRFSPRRFVGPLVLVALVFYFTFHALNGDRGIFAMLKEQRKLEVLQQQLADVSAQRQVLERRVRLLSSASLDPDMLDEQARRELGYTAPGEAIILK